MYLSILLLFLNCNMNTSWDQAKVSSCLSMCSDFPYQRPRLSVDYIVHINKFQVDPHITFGSQGHILISLYGLDPADLFYTLASTTEEVLSLFIVCTCPFTEWWSYNMVWLHPWAPPISPALNVKMHRIAVTLLLNQHFTRGAII